MTKRFWKHKTTMIIAKSVGDDGQEAQQIVRFNRYSTHDESIELREIERNFDLITENLYERAFDRIPAPETGPWLINIVSGKIEKAAFDEIFTTARKLVR